ncbi:MAG: cell division protein ZapA [Alphaproteobacteria bacterium]|nr:cell division protein ZapA [Alphaproteobacteria bacterium]
MSVVAIPILNKNYAMGCEDGQEMRLIEIGKMVDARAKEIQGKIGPLPEGALLATLCIVLADEIMSRKKGDDAALRQVLERIQEIKKKME